MEIGDLGYKLMQAFGWHGKHGRRARLHSLVRDELKRGQSESKVVDRLMEATDSDPALIVEILDQAQFRRALLARFVQRYAAQLRRDGEQITVIPRERDGGGQNACDTQRPGAPTAEQDGGDAADGRAGHARCAAQGIPARPASDQNPADTAGGGGHRTIDAQAADAPADSTRGSAAPGAEGQSRYDTQAPVAPGSHTDTPQLRTGDAMRAAARPKRTGAGTDIGPAMRQCALDRLQINGKPLRVVRADKALEVAEHWHIEARKVEAICTGLAPDKPVGEQLSDAEADVLAERSTRMTA